MAALAVHAAQPAHRPGVGLDRDRDGVACEDGGAHDTRTSDAGVQSGSSADSSTPVSTPWKSVSGGQNNGSVYANALIATQNRRRARTLNLQTSLSKIGLGGATYSGAS